MIYFFKLHWVAIKTHLKLSIYKSNLLTVLLEFILTVWLVLCLKSPHNIKIWFNLNYNVLLGTKYAVLQFESSIFCLLLHFTDNVGVYTGGRGGVTGVMWSDVEPPASPSGRCRWVCLRSAWRRIDAPDTWGQWSAGRAGGATTWRTYHGGRTDLVISMFTIQKLYSVWQWFCFKNTSNLLISFVDQ